MIRETDGAVLCDRCGQELRLGEHPFCPHGFGGPAVNRDEIPGGITLDNYGPQPVTFYSHAERRRYMAEHGLQEREKFSPMPGTDIDPAGIPNPAGYMDPYTLESAAALIRRNGQGAIEPEFDGVRDGVLRNFTDGVLSQQEAQALARIAGGK